MRSNQASLLPGGGRVRGGGIRSKAKAGKNACPSLPFVSDSLACRCNTGWWVWLGLSILASGNGGSLVVRRESRTKVTGRSEPEAQMGFDGPREWKSEDESRI